MLHAVHATSHPSSPFRFLTLGQYSSALSTGYFRWMQALTETSHSTYVRAPARLSDLLKSRDAEPYAFCHLGFVVTLRNSQYLACLC